jgi:hypothetical protein
MQLRWGRVGYLASACCPIFEHVHDITDLPKLLQRALNYWGSGISVERIWNVVASARKSRARCGMDAGRLTDFGRGAQQGGPAATPRQTALYLTSLC